jgi:hypothetical protein
MLLGLLMEDYINFLSMVAQQTNIMDKKFYVVISYPDPDEEHEKRTKTKYRIFYGHGRYV